MSSQPPASNPLEELLRGLYDAILGQEALTELRALQTEAALAVSALDAEKLLKLVGRLHELIARPQGAHEASPSSSPSADAPAARPPSGSSDSPLSASEGADAPPESEGVPAAEESAAGTAADAATTESVDALTALRALPELRDTGVLTSTEYHLKKSELLRRL